MLQWIIIIAVLLFALLLVLLLLASRKQGQQLHNVDFSHYKSREIHSRGHYPNIVK